MLCEICHENEARVTYTEIINGVKKEQHLCENCAAKQSPFNIMGKLGNDAPFGNILSGLLQSFAKGLSTMQQQESICGRCGMTASEFAKIGKLGCPECYNAFAPILDKNLRTVQGAVENKGKRPMNAVYFETLKRDPVQSRAKESGNEEQNDSEKAQLLGAAGTIADILVDPASDPGSRNVKATIKAEISRLRRQMEKAVRDENYEEAASLRDRIHELDGSNRNEGDASAGQKTKDAGAAPQTGVKKTVKKASAGKGTSGKKTTRKEVGKEKKQ